jgi:hypothetical protein
MAHQYLGQFHGASCPSAIGTHRYGVTMRAMLERLILNEDAEILARLELDTPEWDRYIQRVRVTQ